MFFYLLFAHLAADFLLQPSSLIKWKFKSWKGVAVHAAIHLGTYILILLPFLFNGKILLILLGIALSHFCVDVWKVHLESRNHDFVRSFVTDQLLHFGFLVIGTWLIGHPPLFFNFPFLQYFYTSNLAWIGLSSIITGSFAVEVFLYQFQREKDPKFIFKPHYQQIVLRGTVVFILFIGYATLGLLNK